METRIEKCYRKINDAFAEKLNAAFRARFSRELTTTFNITTMCPVSFPSDKGSFTSKQLLWISAYSDGYAAAKKQVWES
ncbi:hypothetical protein [Yersinia mollaretii]|uniref:hypothetical protein n=1 Tax=Yersinia mollaretii TaxID=33060 RepID=UPI0011A0BD49|nr:hypothetical protein [Yersinia mollaretii]